MAPRSPSRARAVAGWGAALAVALAAGCAAPSLGPPTPYPHALDVIVFPVGETLMPWPPSLMTHRAILSIGGTEMALDGRLAVGKSGALRLIALGPMGQVLFDILAEPGREPRMLRVAPAFPEDWVRTRAERDLQVVFRAMPAAPFRTVGDETVMAFGLRLEAPDGTEIRHFRHAWGRSGATFVGPRPWTYIEGVRDGACVYRVTALEPQRFEGLDQPVPSRVRIEAVDYTLDIRIIDLKPGPPPERLFRPAVEGTTDEHR